MARKYNEYIKVDNDFIPVFTNHSDKEHPNKWKSFFPHDSFKSIVSQMIDTLEMNSVEKNKPLWMSGAYGTGKTYASFVMKHLLEDDLNNIKPYFETNNMLPLYARLSGVRSKGKILVVHRSSSSDVSGDNRLYNCIRESIKNALIVNGLSYMGEKSQYDTILSTLKDTSSSFNFEKAFEKYKSKFTQYNSTAGVIKDLEELDLDGRLELLETIVEIAEKENFTWSTSYQDVINWIEDIVKGNKIFAIVFIWDEFTEFFKNNQNRYTGLQELAQAASTIKFYFFLITHSTGSQLINDQNAKKIIEARFKLSPIEMADTTAFKLMSQAVKLNPDLITEWNKEMNDLWTRVEKSAKESIIIFSEDIREEELKKLLPLHPYAAYLLKIISKDISSNQRTMFQFLSGDYEEGENIKHNFRWFIERHSNEFGEWNYLTADYIWDYFFTSENINLDETFKTVLSYYYNYQNLCQRDANKEKVLKVALLLTAMQQKSGASRGRTLSGLLRPTLSNISACFTGTPIQSSIANIMAELVSKSVFGKVEESDDTLFVPPLGAIDEKRFNEMKEEIRKTLTFEKILTEDTYEVNSRFLPNDYLSHRYYIESITTNDYSNALSRVLSLKPNKIPALYIFSKNENEQSKVKSVIEKIYSTVSRELVIVDFSNQILTDITYDKFIHSKTEERYYGNPNQKNQSDLAKRNAKLTIDEWKIKLDMTSLEIYTKPDKIAQCQGGANLRKKLHEINNNIFECGLEQIAVNDNLYKETGFKETVAQMGMSKIPIASSYSYLNQISTKLSNEGIWDNQEYYINNPSHPVSRMKLLIEKVIENGFEQNSKIEISEIWKSLEQKPFGLLSCTGSVFLLGFLLKEYADSTYYKNDGANTVSLNNTDLSDLIFSVVKDNPKSRNQSIVKQTPEHIEFCRLTGSIFRIATDKQNSIDDISKYVKLYLHNNEYPLWSLKYFIQEEIKESDLQENSLAAIELLCEFIATGNVAGRDKPKIAEEIYKLYKCNAGLVDHLESLLKVENMKLGMQYYVGQYKPELIILTKKLGINSDEYIIELNRKFSADSSYLWLMSDTEKQIDNLLLDYQLIDTVNDILPEKKKSFEGISEGVCDKLNIIKIPNNLIIEEIPDLDAIFKTLHAIKNKSYINKSDMLKSIKSKSSDFNNFFNNQYSTFSNIVRNRIDNCIENDEIEALFTGINSGVISTQTDIYIQNLTQELTKYKKSKKSNSLYKLWQRITNSISPAEWSNKYKIPILCLFQKDNEIQLVQNAFEIINKTRIARDENEIDEAISFIQSEHLKVLNDIADCNEIFKNYFSGEYTYVIDDVEELKDVICKNVTTDVYSWLLKKHAIDLVVREFAEKKYIEVYREKVANKIKQLSPEKAQKYLEELIMDKPLVGINILKN